MQDKDVTVYASIGRNVFKAGVVGDAAGWGSYKAGDALDAHDWKEFKRTLEGTLVNAGLDVVTKADGVGVYNGVSEDCHIVAATGNYELPEEWELKDQLADQLSTLAEHYLQETIAYSITETLWADARP
jgi:hypothetical protein